jgi:hypothetical protein
MNIQRGFSNYYASLTQLNSAKFRQHNGAPQNKQWNIYSDRLFWTTDRWRTQSGKHWHAKRATQRLYF